MTHDKNGTLLRRDDAARNLGIPAHALDTMGGMGIGPRRVYLSHVGYAYRRADILDWLIRGRQ
jgi:hypothetical protein